MLAVSRFLYIYHRYLKISGTYRFVGKNIVKLLLSLGLFAGSVIFINHYLWDVESTLQYLFSHFSQWIVMAVFLASESFIGVLPPDLFILWAGGLTQPYVTVLILALCSYAGGFVSWYTGVYLVGRPRIRQAVEVRYAGQFELFKKFGSLALFMAALTPLPFAPVSVAAGLTHFSARRYGLVAGVRFIRFFGYAFVIFSLV